jgi:hypothetical protein
MARRREFVASLASSPFFMEDFSAIRSISLCLNLSSSSFVFVLFECLCLSVNVITKEIHFNHMGYQCIGLLS